MTARSSRSSTDLAEAVFLLAAVWTLLAAAGLFARWMTPSAAVLSSFGLASSLMLWQRPAPTRGVSWAGLAAGFGAGVLGFPAGTRAIEWLGHHAGLAPGTPLAPGAAASVWIANGALAPVFEEILYRGRLLSALRPRLGTPAAIAITSALFAAPHVDAWRVFGTALVGVLLGLISLRGGVALCITIHAGLNCGALASGLPPRTPVLAAVAGGIAGALLLALALARSPFERGRPPPARRPRPDFASETVSTPGDSR